MNYQVTELDLHRTVHEVLRHVATARYTLDASYDVPRATYSALCTMIDDLDGYMADDYYSGIPITPSEIDLIEKYKVLRTRLADVIIFSRGGGVQ